MNKNKKILLVMLPYWTSLIPPLGMSCLKSYLEPHGYDVKTVDANLEDRFKNIYNSYFDALRQIVPPERQGNFYNIGNDVFRNHLMAELNHSETDEPAYTELIKELVYQTYFTRIDTTQAEQLKEIIAEFPRQLEPYFLDLLEKEQPDVLGISVYNATLPVSLTAFRLAKEKYPNLKTVMGGGVFADQLAPGSPNFNHLLETADYIDTFIVGEGERLFLKYLQGEFPENQRVLMLKDIGGETLDLSTVPLPDFSDLNVDGYPTMASYVSRSCPFQCSFCSETIQWGKYRKKKADQIVGELKQLYDAYGDQLFLMGDSLLNPVTDDLSNALLEQETPIYWDGYLRADKPVCDPENTMLWRRGGFYRARLGVESGSPNVLQAMGKVIDPQQIRDAVTSLASAGIKTTTYWVVGHPGESESDFEETLDLIEELKDSIYEAECNPFNFYMGGQVSFNNWKEKALLLYPAEAKKMLIAQTWTLDLEPERSVIYDRVCRFVAHCRGLGIPNPYTITDIYDADERWKNLQKNAVPALMDFKKKGAPLTECRNVKRFIKAAVVTHEDDWDF